MSLNGRTMTFAAVWFALASAHCSAAQPAPPPPAPVATVTQSSAPPPTSGGTGVASAQGAQGPVRYPGVGIRLDALVSLNVWCGFLGYAYCRHCQPGELAACNNVFVSSCLGGRDASLMTQRTLFDAQMCGNALQQADCPSVGRGALPQACQPSGGSAEPDGEVDLWTWCSTLSQNFCRNCSAAEPDACIDAFVPACLAQRDPRMPTGRMRSEMRACGLQLETAACETVTQGVLPPACRPPGR